MKSIVHGTLGGAIVVAVCALGLSGCAPESSSPDADASAPFDVIVDNARVIDPETGLDATRSVGLRGGVIAAVTETPLEVLAQDGVRIDGTGRVLAPGFVDLHAHGQSPRAHDYQAMDGVTTALELEWGYPSVGAWIEEKRGKARIHYGASVAHGLVRSLVIESDPDRRAALQQGYLDSVGADDALRAFQAHGGVYNYDVLAAESYSQLDELLATGLAEGGLGIGMAHQYYPGASQEEIFHVFEWAAAQEVPIFTHVREMGMAGVQEVVANAAATGGAVHIVHLNSSSLSSLSQTLRLVAGARESGVDVTAETYPYTAGSTSIQSALFDEGWQERLGGIDHGDIQWQDSGERLDEESFASYRVKGGTVIIHMMQDEIVQQAVADPSIIIASDGMPYAPGAHPRSAGTFSRVLGRYVRERGALSLPDAINKMSYLPAKRLEGIAPAMRSKGRVQVGADADLVVFDPEAVIDTATFEDDLTYSRGFDWVFVAGVAVVAEGELVAGVAPGQPVLSRQAASE